MVASAARRAAPGNCPVRWLAVLGLVAGVNVAAAALPETVFTLRARNAGGEGILRVTAGECIWDPVLLKLEWVLAQPRVVTNPLTNDAIATLQTAKVQFYYGSTPRIQLDFMVEAGATTTAFILEPGALRLPLPSGTVTDPTGEPLELAEARAAVSLSVTDKNSNGAELRAVGPPGTGIYQCRFNGVAPEGYLFSTMLYQILCGPGGSAKVSQYDPPIGYRRLDIPAYDMSTYTAFTLTAGDVAQASTSLRLRYVQVPVSPQPAPPSQGPPVEPTPL